MAGYDREFTTPLAFGVRRRIGYSHDRGRITRFVVQLEYRLANEWVELVRSGHDETSAHRHDVTEDGVHLDVFRDGTNARSAEIFPPMPPNEALTFVEDHIAEHGERYVKRFEA